jgi:hypothetical protein
MWYLIWNCDRTLVLGWYITKQILSLREAQLRLDYAHPS